MDHAGQLDGNGSSSDARRVSELALLVRDAHERGMSYEQMRINAGNKGFSLSGSYFHQLEKGRVKRPKERTLPAIAAGLKLREKTVREAAARAGGVHVEHDVNFETGQLLNIVDAMGPENRELWLRLAAAIAGVLSERVDVRLTLTPEGREIIPGEHSERLVQAELDRETQAITPADQRRQTR